MPFCKSHLPQRWPGESVEASWGDTTELYERALAYAQKRLDTKPAGQRAGFSREQWRACAEFGFAGLCAPVELGGMGLGALGTARIVEALGRGCPDMGLVFSICAHLFAAVMPIVEHGSSRL